MLHQQHQALGLLISEGATIHSPSLFVAETPRGLHEVRRALSRVDRAKRICPQPRVGAAPATDSAVLGFESKLAIEVERAP